jgi:hypothetical protein
VSHKDTHKPRQNGYGFLPRPPRPPPPPREAPDARFFACEAGLSLDTSCFTAWRGAPATTLGARPDEEEAELDAGCSAGGSSAFRLVPPNCGTRIPAAKSVNLIASAGGIFQPFMLAEPAMFNTLLHVRANSELNGAT